MVVNPELTLIVSYECLWGCVCVFPRIQYMAASGAC